MISASIRFLLFCCAVCSLSYSMLKESDQLPDERQPLFPGASCSPFSPQKDQGSWNTDSYFFLVFLNAICELLTISSRICLVTLSIVFCCNRVLARISHHFFLHSVLSVSCFATL